jgi:hypothetical protein
MIRAGPRRTSSDGGAMARYDRRYDFGLRGDDRGMGGRGAPARYDRGQLADRSAAERRTEPRTPRVTARYNRDYVFGGRGEDAYPRNHTTFGGDRPDRIGDERYMRQPYTTIGGTRTFRGSPEPIGYDRDFVEYDADFHPFR